jgi:hypothetical protein
MNHFHPDALTGERREAASQYYPLIGLYDSNDPDALECQALLMKFSGIDGAIIDWSGTDDFLDYGINHRNTLHFIQYLKKAGLKFAIMYEDATVPRMIEAKRFPETEAVTHGKSTLLWIQEHWFRDSAYATWQNRPLFMVFGWGYYKGEQWTDIFSGLPTVPAYFSESGRRGPAVGGFDWPQPVKGTEVALQETKQFYTESNTWPTFIPAAYPRFHDIYEQAGVQKSWGQIEDRDGKTYAETLEQALKSHPSLIQLVTWNDWGEGTQIEPSVEFGYRDLAVTQRLSKKYRNPALSYTEKDLSLPVELYKLRKRPGNDATMQAKLDEISRLLYAGQTDKARKQLAAVSLKARP